MEIEAAKVIGAGLAVIGVIGSGIGIGNIFSSLAIPMLCPLAIRKNGTATLSLLH